MRRARQSRLLPAAAAAILLAAGCVRREVAVTSEPPGARVTINGADVGTTPTGALRFTHYGTWRVELRLAGHKPVIEDVRIGPPLFERAGPDLLAGLVPWTIRDRRTLHYTLEKAEDLSKEEILDRARAAVEGASLPAPPEKPAAREDEEEWKPSRPLPPESDPNR